MERAYKFRIYPNKAQEEQIQKTFKCCDFVYNHYLAVRQEAYERSGRIINYYACSKDLTRLKKALPWLAEADATALQASLQNLERAYQDYFKNRRPSPPRPKKERRPRKSYASKSNGGRVKVFENAVQLSKLGRVRCRVSNEVAGRILSATVSQNPDRKYYVSVCCTDVEIPPLPPTGKAVGLDMGLKTLAVSSDGTEYPNPKYFEKSQRRLAILQRRLSRKEKGSKRYEKARIQVAKMYEHIANQRKDTLHKLSAGLVRENDILCIEDLACRNMLKNHNVAKSIADASWGTLRGQLKYKSAWYGRELVVINRFFPSSQLCSVCGAKNPAVKDLSVRSWTCPVCGAVHDRDVNAAKNILTEGLRQLA